MVLVPGTLCDAALWADVAVPGGAHVLNMVRGRSLADTAEQVLNDVQDGTRLHLVGFSLGAIVAFEVLRRVPERLSRLTLISANPHAPLPLQLETWAAQAGQVRAGHFEEVAQVIADTSGPHRQKVLEMARRVGPEVYLEQLDLLRSRPDSRGDLARFTGPLTLLVGGEDRVTPPHLAAELHALDPHAAVRVVPGAGHYLPLDAPDAISDVLNGVAHA